MADTTDVLAIPFPEGGDTFAASDVQDLAERVDEAPGVESLTAAEIAALGAALKPAGRVVYNSDTGKLQISNGTLFADLDADLLPLAGGTMSGDIDMDGNQVTGMAEATTDGDAVEYGQWDDVNATFQTIDNLRTGTVGTASYTTGGMSASFASAMTTTPILAVSQTVSSGSSTPLHIMAHTVTDSGFSWKAFRLDTGAELAAGLSVTFTYIAAIV